MEQEQNLAELVRLVRQLADGQRKLVERLEALGQPQPEYFSIYRAAEMAELSYDHVRRAVESGELPAMDKGNGKKRLYRIARDDFDRWMRKGRSGGDVLPLRSELKEKVNRYLPGLAA